MVKDNNDDNNQTIAQWIVKVMNSCINIEQLENSYVLIERHYMLFNDAIARADMNTLYQNYKINLNEE